MYSIIGLIIEIFYDNLNLHKVEINNIKTNYLKLIDNVSNNVLINSIPTFIIIEILYNNNNDISYLYIIGQSIIVCLLGINIDYGVHQLRHSKYFIKYHKIHHSLTQPLNPISTFYTHLYDFQLSLIPIIFPTILGFYPIVIHSWIFIYLSKSMMINYGNLKKLSVLYEIHHKYQYCNYGVPIMDNYYNTLKIEYDEGKEEGKHIELNYNKKCYEYICKTNINEILNKKKKLISGKLHYSNFF